MFMITSFASGAGRAERPLTALRQLINDVWIAFETNRSQRRAESRVRDELHAYSDRELADLGITRGDIDQIARSATF